MSFLIECHSWIVLFTVKTLLNAHSCIIEERITCLDLIIQYSIICFAEFIIWVPTMFVLTYPDTADKPLCYNWELWNIQYDRQDGGYKKSYILPQHIPYQFSCHKAFLINHLIRSMSYCHYLEVWTRKDVTHIVSSHVSNQIDSISRAVTVKGMKLGLPI